MYIDRKLIADDTVKKASSCFSKTSIIKVIKYKKKKCVCEN